VISTSRRVRALSSFWCVLGLMGGAALVGSGCAQTETPANGASPGASPAANGSPAAGSAPGTLKVGLVTPGKVSDNWSGLAAKGVEQVKTELGAETLPPVEAPALAQVETTFRELANQGATVVFGHGSEYDDAAVAAAKEAPKTYFVVMGGKQTGSNVMPIQIQSPQATYLAGMLAGGMTKSNKIGLVGGTELQIIKDAFTAFEKGAKAVNPKVEVKTTFTGSFDDVAKAKQQAQALLGSGVDVIMHNANDAGRGVFQAVEEKAGALVIGANADESDKATDRNLGSFILDVPGAMVAAAKAVKEGRADGGAFKPGLKEKAAYFKFNDQFKGTIPEDLKAKMKKAEAEMIAGKLDPMK
jgi:basic membrane protein A and related proteins